MAKFGYRKPSIKKSISARTTGKVKRKIKSSINPAYGKKGMGWVNNPKKAAYGKVYNKTSRSSYKTNKSQSSKGCGCGCGTIFAILFAIGIIGMLLEGFTTIIQVLAMISIFIGLPGTFISIVILFIMFLIKKYHLVATWYTITLTNFAAYLLGVIIIGFPIAPHIVIWIFQTILFLIVFVIVTNNKNFKAYVKSITPRDSSPFDNKEALEKQNDDEDEWDF